MSRAGKYDKKSLLTIDFKNISISDYIVSSPTSVPLPNEYLDERCSFSSRTSLRVSSGITVVFSRSCCKKHEIVFTPCSYSRMQPQVTALTLYQTSFKKHIQASIFSPFLSSHRGALLEFKICGVFCIIRDYQ